MMLKCILEREYVCGEREREGNIQLDKLPIDISFLSRE